MSLKDKLQIYIITYNRKEKFRYTLDEILKSPVKDFDITILDNSSTDGTSELIDEYCANYSNLKHIRHNVNIGGNANICRAFELSASCGKEYAWILCDDDRYDFSNWQKVEEYIEQDKDIICVSDYVFPHNEDKTNKAYQIFQMTFVPASIFKTKNINSTVLINMYDSIIMMLQQSCLTIHVINNGGEIAVLDKPIVHNGLHFETNVDPETVLYTRGMEEKEILKRRNDTYWILGFSNVVSLLKDKSLQKQCLEAAIPYRDIYGSWKNFYFWIYDNYYNFNNYNYFLEIYKLLTLHRKILLIRFCLTVVLKKLIRLIFSITRTKDRKQKVLTVFGFKFYYEAKKKK